MGRIGVTQKATFIPVFNLHNTWDCQLGFSSNVLSINRTECGDSQSCSQLKEAFGTGTAELLQVQELWPRQSEDQSPRPWTLSPALPCFMSHFWQLQGVCVKPALCLDREAAALSLTTVPVSLSCLWLPGSSPPPSHFLFRNSLVPAWIYFLWREFKSAALQRYTLSFSKATACVSFARMNISVT